MSIVVENANQYGNINETRLRALEERLGVSLPSDYRAFLQKYNGGIPVPGGFWITEGSDGSSIHQFYGLHDGPDWLQLDIYSSAERGIPKDLLAIGDDGVGNTICIEVSREEQGRIFFIDHDLHPFHEPESLAGITKIVDSFQEFLSALKELPP